MWLQQHGEFEGYCPRAIVPSNRKQKLPPVQHLNLETGMVSPLHILLVKEPSEIQEHGMKTSPLDWKSIREFSL
jgi:hypothetical protein